MILALQESLAAQVRAVARATLGAEPGYRRGPVSPQDRAGRPRPDRPFRPREDACAASPARSRRPWPPSSRRLPGVRKAEVAGGGYVNLFLDRGAVRAAVHERLAGARARPRRAGRASSSSTPASTPTRPPTSATCATPPSATPSCACCGHRGHEVGVQNYIDDTGVQVADVVVGFLHLEKIALAEVEAPRRPVRLLLLGPLRAGRRLLRGRSRQQEAAGGDPARDRDGRQTRPRASPPTWPRASSTATWRPWSAWASATTCSPTRATSCGCTSGTAPSSC